MSVFTELTCVEPGDVPPNKQEDTKNINLDGVEITEKRMRFTEGICILQETVFVDSEIRDEQIFENLNIKVEPVYVETEEDTVEPRSEANTKSKKHVKKKKIKVAQVKKKKVAKDRLAAMREKLKKNSQQKLKDGEDGRRLRVNNPELDIYKNIIDEFGKETKVKVEETADERRRRLARERMRRKRMNMTEFERQIAMRKQRIQKQKLRLRQRLEETEEEAEVRKREYREQKRRSRQKMRKMSESTGDEDSKRCLSFTTSDGEIKYETADERERRLARERQRRRRFRISEIEKEIEMEHLKMNQSSLKQLERDGETEDERELRRLKYRLQKQHSRKRLKELIELDGESEFQENDDIGQQDACADFLKNNRKKRAPDDIEYLYFYENSEERRKRLDRERHKAKYRARKQMEREVLDIEDESDIITSRRCLDFD